MKINFIKKILSCFTILLIYTFLFPLNNVFAESITVNDSTKVLKVQHSHGSQNGHNNATEGFCFVENNLLAVCDTVITGDKSKDYSNVYLYTYDFGTGFDSSRTTRLDDSSVVCNTHSNSMTYDPQNKKLIIASDGMHIYSVDLQNNKILNDEQTIDLSGHAIGYDSARNKIVTYNGSDIRCYEPSDFYSGNKDKSTKRVYPKKTNASSQGLGAFGGLAFLIFSNTDGTRYVGNTIVVYDIENGKEVTSLETSYVNELEDCMFDSSGNLYVTDTMGNVFKPGINAYNLGANGSVTNPTSTTSTTQNSLLETIMQFAAFLFNTVSDLAQAFYESVETNKPYMNCLKLTRTSTEISADAQLNGKLNYAQTMCTTTSEDEETDNSDSTTSESEETENSGSSTPESGETGTLTLKEFTIPSTVQDKLGNTQTVYSLGTPIPAFEVSIENLFINTINIVDVDFFNTANNNPNKTWIVCRKIITTVSHGTIYICSAALIAMLVLRSIFLVMQSIRGLPKEAKNSKQIMDNLLGAIAIFTGIFIIMSLCIYLNDLLINVIIGSNKTNYLLKFNVENVCTFNGNIMTYLKYRSLSTNTMDCAKWSLIRLIVTFETGVLFISMIGRMLIMGGLLICAPITAVTYMREKNVQNKKNMKSIFYVKPFISYYAKLAFIPTICTFILFVFLKI